MRDVVWMLLYSTKGIGIRKILTLHNQLPKLTIDNLTNPDVQSEIGKIIGERNISLMADPDSLQIKINKIYQMIERHRDAGIEMITLFDDRYPRILKFLPDPPLVLYCKGNIGALNLKKIAVIGARECSPKGEYLAAEFSRQLSSHGWTVVSGLAKGIDTAAHKGTLDVKGKTIAVLPGPLDNIMPRVNKELAQDIIDNNGLLVTEYPLGTTIKKNYYVARDRIQSGLSLAVFVIQTSLTGGTMQTARFTLEQKRLLLCPEPFESFEFDCNKGVELLMRTKAATTISAEQFASIDELIADHYKDSNILGNNTNESMSYTDNLCQPTLSFE